ncbi:methionine import ATP-binding protein MetN [Limoniibacter endophyticus]|uniref:Methionine import ATP-binding protein MetN n=1 Tax=Limoniibacter endophyticus TaxID=1565040 RepID=A0A8J3DNX2_9HYPH|nr:methionine import ATP-binding protein MetN [Limoniibacter endophyticus]
MLAVDNVSLDVEAGTICGIIGYSGAGKSTLIRLFNGLEKPSGGTITVAGTSIGDASEATLRRVRPKLGMIFQHFNLLWSRTVAQNIAFPLEIAGKDKVEINARVKELVALVGLEGRENAWPSQLSGGQKQRVGIARALANDPHVLLCDEATSALDPQTTDSILDLLLDINRKLNLTIVLITHEMHVVRHICSRVAVMEAGRVVEEGPVLEVFSRPKQEITRRFVRQIERADEAIPAFEPPIYATGEGAFVRLVYDGRRAQEPVLAQAIQKFALGINVVHGQLNKTRDGSFGELYVHIPAQGEALEAVLSFVRDAGVDAQIVSKS